MRAIGAALLLFASVSAAGQTFEVGSKVSGPHTASLIKAVRMGPGAIALWQRSDYKGAFLVRVGASGERIGESVPLASGETPCLGGMLVSNGREALLLCHAGRLMAARVTEKGIGALHEVQFSGAVSALEWNGRHYVAVVRSGSGDLSALLLDGEGVPASGVVAIRRYDYKPGALACGSLRCLLVLPGKGGLVFGAVFDETSFPAIGQQAFPIWPMRVFDGLEVAVGFDAQGFYSVTRSTSLIFRRHGFLKGVHANIGSPRQVWSLTPSGYGLNTVGQGGQVYIAYSAYSSDSSRRVVLLRIASDSVTEVPVANGVSREIVALVSGVSGPIAFWRNASGPIYVAGEPSPIYATAIHRDASTMEENLVSIAPGVGMMPRLARGSNTLLAVWLEERAGDRDELFAAILDVDGRPLTQAVLVARADDVIVDAAIAFDGVNFFVVWKDGNRWTDHPDGRLISQDGQLLGETIHIPIHSYALTVVWSGREYLMSGSDSYFASQGGLWRISPSGAMLGAHARFRDFGYEAAILVLSESGGLTGLGLSFSHSYFSAGPQLYASYDWVSLDDGDLGPTEQTLGPSSEQTYAFEGATPAVARGGFAVIDASGWEVGLRILGSNERLEYPAPEADRIVHLYAYWLGNQYLVGAGKVLARHAPDHTLLGFTSLGDDVRDAAIVPDGPDAVVVLQQSGLRRMEALRVAVPVY